MEPLNSKEIQDWYSQTLPRLTSTDGNRWALNVPDGYANIWSCESHTSRWHLEWDGDWMAPTLVTWEDWDGWSDLGIIPWKCHVVLEDYMTQTYTIIRDDALWRVPYVREKLRLWWMDFKWKVKKTRAIWA